MQNPVCCKGRVGPTSKCNRGHPIFPSPHPPSCQRELTCDPLSNCCVLTKVHLFRTWLCLGRFRQVNALWPVALWTHASTSEPFAAAVYQECPALGKSHPAKTRKKYTLLPGWEYMYPAYKTRLWLLCTFGMLVLGRVFSILSLRQALSILWVRLGDPPIAGGSGPFSWVDGFHLGLLSTIFLEWLHQWLKDNLFERLFGTDWWVGCWLAGWQKQT